MGSFIVRRLMMLPDAGNPAGVILSGSADIDPLSGGLMRFLAAAGILFGGERHRSPLLHQLAFAANNTPYRKGKRTDVDWLSRDSDNNLRYTADPLCGFVCTASFYRELGRGFSAIGTNKGFSGWPPEVPLLIAAGSRDPIGSCGKGPRALERKYRKGGVRDVTLHLAEGARHEILNETDRVATGTLMRDWILGRT